MYTLYILYNTILYTLYYIIIYFKMTSSTPNQQEILTKYNDIKNKYTIFFQKAIELEDELREHK